MKPEDSLPLLEVPATCRYTEPARSSPHPHIPLPQDLSLFMSYQRISPGPRLTLWLFRNMINMILFYSEELLAPRPTPKPED